MNESQELLSQIVTYNKYARYRQDLKRRETWEEIIDRYVGMMLKKHCGDKYEQQWKQKKMDVTNSPLAKDIVEKAAFLYRKDVLPSMRALQFAGPAISKTESRVYNCAYVPINHYTCFSELMFLLLGGTGVGYSVQYNHVRELPDLLKPTKKRKFLVNDSIEGWADAIKALFKAYFGITRYKPRFDFSDIREKGARLVTAGGKAPGPDPLRICLTKIEALLNNVDNNSQLRPIDVHDICCFIADAVLAGGIRRAAMIALFSFDDEYMATCKHGSWWDKNPQRGRCNNSAVIVRNRVSRKEFSEFWKVVKASNSGEPGISLSNDPNYGTNPCAEISLRPYQFCNLTEINAGSIRDQEDFNERCRVAAFWGTLQAGFTDFHYLRPVWQSNTEKDSLVGVGMTGIANGNVELLNLEEGSIHVKQENERIADILGINHAARTTTIKPSGCSKKDTMIITNRGLLTLEEIGDINGNKWQTHDIEVSQEQGLAQSNLFYINGKSPTKKILTSGGIELESSLTHQYRVIRNGNYIWVKTPNIKIGDVLPFKIGGYNGGSLQKLDKFKQTKTTNLNIIEQPTHLNNNLAWLLGLYLADGSTHKKGIRIAGDINKLNDLKKASTIIKEQFNIECLIYERTNGNNADLYANSKSLLKWLKLNDLIKPKTKYIEIPLIIRKSPKDIIKSYIDGYGIGDGSTKTHCRSFCTISKKMASQLIVVLRSIGIDAKCRLMPPTKTSFGDNMRYWISERKGRTVKERYIKKSVRNIWRQLDKLGLKDFNFDTVVDIQNGFTDTYDISVPKRNTYISESYVSHNTTSCVVGTSSGIHAWHSEYYIRNMQCAVGDDLYNYFMANHPDLIKEMDYQPGSAVIGIPMKAPSSAIMREEESAIQFLERVKRFNEEWIQTGHRTGPNYNNVSATVSIKDNEWDDVGNWMWINRKVYSGISVLPFDGGTYADAPFTDCTKYEYDKRMKYIRDNPIDLTRIKEEFDNTNLKGELACQGGSCELTY